MLNTTPQRQDTRTVTQMKNAVMQRSSDHRGQFAEGLDVLELEVGLLDKLLTKWASNRELIVLQLRNMANKLDEVQHSCNISTTVGSSVGIVSGIVTIIGIAAFPPAAIGGLIFGVAAAASNTTTGIVNVVIIKKKWKEVEALFAKDEIFLKDVLDQIEKVQQIAEVSDLSLTDTSVLQLCSSVGAAGAKVAGVGARLLLREAAVLAPNIARGLAHAAAGLGIGLDAITLIFTARDMATGSRSDFAFKLRELANQAEAEKREVLINVVIRRL